MARPVILGNSSLTVGLNEQGLVHDFYYPYVGEDNLTTARNAHHKIGVWVDGTFSWVDDGTWLISVDFRDDALISHITMKSTSLMVEIALQDFVDSEFNAFCRQMTLSNLADHKREMRVFFHQVFQISSAGRADTALFVPDANYILDYKGRCSLLIYAKDQDGHHFDQYAVGGYGVEGKEGTYRDAEDGELSGSAVEHGGVDSVVRVTSNVEGNKTALIDYWVVAADSQYSAEKIHDEILTETIEVRRDKTVEHWHNWLATADSSFNKVEHKYLSLFKKSLMMIKAHTDKHGGVIASCDSSIYNYGRDYYSYVWPRDGAYVMWPLIRLGFKAEPKAFFRFCRDIISQEGFMMHKYQPDKAVGSTWHPLIHNKRKELAIQEDETAIIIYMLGEYLNYSDDKEFVLSLYDKLIRPAANFMAGFIDPSTHLPHASYDLWEEKFSTSTYTTAVTYQALLIAADFADDFDHNEDGIRWRQVAELILENSDKLFDTDRNAFRKGFLLQTDGLEVQNDNTLDVSSLYGPMMFGLHDKAATKLHQTAEQIEKVLLGSTPTGGTPRYEHDNYFLTKHEFMGNPWLVTTLWMAQYYIRTGDSDKAKELIAWTMAHSLYSGALTEQVDPVNGTPLSVNPLAWSHAEFINTVLDLYQ